jgi:hypothetical protein
MAIAPQVLAEYAHVVTDERRLQRDTNLSARWGPNAWQLKDVVVHLSDEEFEELVGTIAKRCTNCTYPWVEKRWSERQRLCPTWCEKLRFGLK